MESWMRPLLLVAMTGAAAAGSLRYDQTQNGDTNIHLEVKNVEVVALLGDSSFEYEYDDSDLTETPPKPGANSTWPTYDPIVEAANPNATEEEQAVLGSTTTTTAPDNSTTTASASDPVAAASPAAPAASPAAPVASAASGSDPVAAAPAASVPAATDSATSPPPASSAAPTKRARRCGAGFHRDANGHCRRVRRPNLQMLMHLGRKPQQADTAAISSPPQQQ